MAQICVTFQQPPFKRHIVNYGDICAMESRRQAKVSRLIHREIASILQKNSNSWFSVQFITVSKISVTPDLSYAKVYLTFLNEPNPQEKVDMVKTKTGEIKLQLGRALKNEMRKLPDINFFYDDTLDYVENMDTLFKKLNDNSSDKGDSAE